VTRLRQILVNLLPTPSVFTAKGDVSVSVTRAEKRGERPLCPLFRVGQRHRHSRRQGRPALPVVSQVDPSTTRKFGGTGLGLAISRKLAEIDGRQHLVESEEGKGSAFHVRCRSRKHSPQATGSQPDSSRARR